MEEIENSLIDLQSKIVERINEIEAKSDKKFFDERSLLFLQMAFNECKLGLIPVEIGPPMALVHLLRATSLVGTVNGYSHAAKYIRNQASAKAIKRNAENRQLREFALKHYADNISSFKSMDDAAEKIAEKIVPAKFRAVRNWITQYHKNLRSAGTT